MAHHRTDRTRSTSSSQRFRGERAVTIIMTALLLVPLMVFAAYGVDLAGFYSRVSQLQRAADAAALAGTVWMPDFTKARTEAAASLRKNGFVDGVDDIEVRYFPGSEINSLVVEIEDTSATTYFSNVIGHRQAIARSAEAQYNLPIPLGSPLNYFGGDSEKTQPAPVFTVTWPNPYDDNGWMPAGPGGNCVVGTAEAQGLGRWNGGLTYQSGWYSTAPRCEWSAQVTGAAPIYDTRPPAGHFLVTRPDVIRCQVDLGNSNNDYWGRFENDGRWNVDSSDPNDPPGSNSWPYCRWAGATQPPNQLPSNYSDDRDGCNVRVGGTFYGRYTRNGEWRRTSDSAPDCQWIVGSTPGTTNASTLPPFYQTQAPANPGCNVGAEGSYGQWTSSSGWSPGITTGRPLCRWPAEVIDNTPPNPIDPGRSPKFWAVIEGPGTSATQGDVYSTRCYRGANCSSVQNELYEEESDTERGYWYAVKIPDGLTGSVDIRVFDASYRWDGEQDELAGDSPINNYSPDPRYVSRDPAYRQNFATEFKVFQQQNPLDFSTRTSLSAANSGDAAEGSCWWRLEQQSEFRGAWKRLCTITGVQPGEIYLVNVQTRSTGNPASGTNGYALEACANGSCTSGVQPALYAYNKMAMYNNVSSGDATFYIAEVGPQYAGKVLVLSLWDAGDSSADATLYPMMPSATLPKPVVNVPAADCTYTADPTPNEVQNNAVGGGTGRIVETPHASDTSSVCGIRTTIGSSRQFNADWLRIRIDIPQDYTCIPGVNPETTPGSCWWGIKYSFSASSTDVTSWQARIEGNPVHLTE